ncbi:MAG TPA: hypothetical protein VMH81_06520 [Bryobacteraceae bacterium]|nr:hypothetical protein [Bryobacteraceae bacterium]
MSWKTTGLAFCLGPLFLVAIGAASQIPQTAGAAKATRDASKAVAGHAETLSATIKMVDVNEKLLFAKTADGVSYCFSIRPATRISAGGHTIKLADLALYADKAVSVKFDATRQGNIAQSIDVSH